MVIFSLTVLTSGITQASRKHLIERLWDEQEIEDALESI